MPSNTAPSSPVAYGYARVIARDDDLTDQITALVAAGITRKAISKEIGTEGDVFATLARRLRPGDRIVVSRLDRLAANITQLTLHYQMIRQAGAALQVLNPPIDTGTQTGRAKLAMLPVFVAFDAAVRGDLVRAGLARAKSEGRKNGRRATHTHAQILAAAKHGMPAGAARLGMSRAGFLKAKRRADKALLQKGTRS